MPEQLALAATITLESPGVAPFPDGLEGYLRKLTTGQVIGGWEIRAVEVGEEISASALARVIGDELDRQDVSADTDAIARAVLLEAPIPPARRGLERADYPLLAAALDALLRMNAAWQEADLGATTLAPETILGVVELLTRLRRLAQP